jgi:hypothetical protein
MCDTEVTAVALMRVGPGQLRALQPEVEVIV